MKVAKGSGLAESGVAPLGFSHCLVEEREWAKSTFRRDDGPKEDIPIHS